MGIEISRPTEATPLRNQQVLRGAPNPFDMDQTPAHVEPKKIGFLARIKNFFARLGRLFSKKPPPTPSELGFRSETIYREREPKQANPAAWLHPNTTITNLGKSENPFAGDKSTKPIPRVKQPAQQNKRVQAPQEKNPFDI